MASKKRLKKKKVITAAQRKKLNRKRGLKAAATRKRNEAKLTSEEKAALKKKRSEAAKKGAETKRKKKREGQAEIRREETHPEVTPIISAYEKRIRELEEQNRVFRATFERQGLDYSVQQMFADFEEATGDMEYTMESRIITRIEALELEGHGFDSTVAFEVLDEYADEYDFLTVSDIYDIWYYGEMAA